MWFVKPIKHVIKHTIYTFIKKLEKNSKNNGVGSLFGSDTTHIANPYFQVPFLKDSSQSTKQGIPRSIKDTEVEAVNILVCAVSKIFPATIFQVPFFHQQFFSNG